MIKPAKTPTKPRLRCSRVGCERYVPARMQREHTVCSRLCKAVVHELEISQRICEATGDSALWASAVELSDALSAHWSNTARVYNAARQVGISIETWSAIKNGTAIAS